MSQDGSWDQLFEELFNDWREENKRELEVDAWYTNAGGIEINTRASDWHIHPDGSISRTWPN